MTTALEEIAIADQNRQVEILRDYHALCLAIATDDDVDPVEASRVTADAGKTREQLASDAATMRRRVAYRRKLDQRSAKKSIIEDADAAIAQVNAALQEAQAKYQAELRELVNQREQAKRKLGEIQAAEDYLRQTVIDGRIEIERQAIADDRKRVGKALQRCRLRLRANEPTSEVYKLPLREQVLAKAHEELADATNAKGDKAAEMVANAQIRVDEAREAVQSSRNRIAELQEELAQLKDEHDAIERRGAALRSKELSP